MRRFMLCLAVIMAVMPVSFAWGDVGIDEEHFPDAKFMAYISNNLDTDKNGVLSDAEIAEVTKINVFDKGISSLQGIEYFTALTKLYCQVNQLTELNVSNNTALTELYCHDNRLTKLNVSSNTALEYLRCDVNYLTELDVSNNAALKFLACNNNYLIELDVSNNTNLTELICLYNELTTLDLSHNTALRSKSLKCSPQNVFPLLVAETGDSSHPYQLNFGEYMSSEKFANISSDDVFAFYSYPFGTQAAYSNGVALLESRPIVVRYCYSTGCSTTKMEVNISATPPSGSVEVTATNFPDANFREYVSSTLDKNGDSVLTPREIVMCNAINADGLNISSLKGVEKFFLLNTLTCSNNQLTALDVSKNTALITLECSNNQLTTLDVSKNTALTKLGCSNNQLRNLDVSKNTALITLECSNNQLANLDVSKNTLLTVLKCYSQEVHADSFRQYITYAEDSSSWMFDIFFFFHNAVPYDQDITKITEMQGFTSSGSNILTKFESDYRMTVLFAEYPAKITYKYATGNSAAPTMDVTISDGSAPPAPAPADNKPLITTTDLPVATINQPYTFQLTASGTTPITWSRKSGSLPKGLTLSDSGIISGTPTKAGKYTFTVIATNAQGSDTQKFTLIVYEPVSIITASLKPAIVAKNYSVTLMAKGTKPLTWSAEGLPNGLTINEKGRISGKPTVYGTFSVKITASNEAGSLTKELLLMVKGIAPKLSGSLAKATLNESYSSGLKLTAGSLPVTWSCTGTLPDGLTFDTETGIISGTPTSYEKSGYRLTITAMNDAGSKSKNVTLRVKAIAPKITTKKLQDATLGSTYNMTLTATGSEPITWTASGLPEGLYVYGNTITGTPTEAGNRFTVILYAENPVKSVKKSLTLKVNIEGDLRLPAVRKTAEESYSALPSKDSEETSQPQSGGYIIVTELGEISCDMAGMYEFDATLNEDAPTGWKLAYMAGSDNPSDDDEIAEFYDESGEEISAVPESRRITVSIWLNPGTIYKPQVLAISE